MLEWGYQYSNFSFYVVYHCIYGQKSSFMAPLTPGRKTKFPPTYPTMYRSK